MKIDLENKYNYNINKKNILNFGGINQNYLLHLLLFMYTYIIIIRV